MASSCSGSSAQLPQTEGGNDKGAPGDWAGHSPVSDWGLGCAMEGHRQDLSPVLGGSGRGIGGVRGRHQGSSGAMASSYCCTRSSPFGQSGLGAHQPGQNLSGGQPVITPPSSFVFSTTCVGERLENNDAYFAIMGNSNSTPLQKCLNTVCNGRTDCVGYPSDLLYQSKWVKTYNKAIDVTPVAVIKPNTAADVAAAVKCAVEGKVHVQAKSGGHSYAYVLLAIMIVG